MENEELMTTESVDEEVMVTEMEPSEDGSMLGAAVIVGLAAGAGATIGFAAKKLVGFVSDKIEESQVKNCEKLNAKQLDKLLSKLDKKVDKANEEIDVIKERQQILTDEIVSRQEKIEKIKAAQAAKEDDSDEETSEE